MYTNARVELEPAGATKHTRHSKAACSRQVQCQVLLIANADWSGRKLTPACWKAKGRDSTPAPMAELHSMKTLCIDDSAGRSCGLVTSSGCGDKSKDDSSMTPARSSWLSSTSLPLEEDIFGLNVLPGKSLSSN